MGCFPCKGETWVAFLVRERLGLLSWLGRDLACFPCEGKACVAFQVRERLVLLSGLGKGLVAFRVRERLR